MTIRVPILKVNLQFGFASRMVFLLWCVCGGLLLHMLESNYLTILLKPSYEKPADNAEDIVERGFTIVYAPGTESRVEIMKKSPFRNTRAMAEKTIVAKVTFYSWKPS